MKIKCQNMFPMGNVNIRKTRFVWLHWDDDVEFDEMVDDEITIGVLA
jgi:hypothetical protein